MCLFITEQLDHTEDFAMSIIEGVNIFPSFAMNFGLIAINTFGFRIMVFIVG